MCIFGITVKGDVVLPNDMYKELHIVRIKLVPESILGVVHK